MEFYRDNSNHGSLRAIAGLKNAEVLDEITLTLYYDAPYFAYLNDLCYPEVAGMVSPKVIEEGNFQTLKDVIGMGAYRFAEQKLGESTKFERNADYWGEPAQYEEVIVKYIPESGSRLQALQNREIDLMFGSALMSYDDLHKPLP